MTRAVVIPERVIELLEDAPKGNAGLTIWETAEGHWQVSIKRSDGSYAVQIARSIHAAFDAFVTDERVVEEVLRKVRASARPSRRDIIGDRPRSNIGSRRYGHPGD